MRGALVNNVRRIFLLLGATACAPSPSGRIETPVTANHEPAAIESLMRDGIAHNSAGQFHEGEARLTEALTRLREQRAPDAELLVRVLRGLASSYLGAGQPVRSREVASEALRLLQPGAAGSDEQIWGLERIIGKSYAREGQTALAIESHRRALAAAARHPDGLREDVVRSHIDISLVHVAAGQTAAATNSAEQAWEAARRANKRDRVTHDAALNLVATYSNAGRTESAERLLEDEQGAVRVWRAGQATPEKAALKDDVLRPVARGKVVGSPEVAVRLSDHWAYCAYQARATGGTARLTATVARDGRVSEVVLTAFGVNEPAANCMILATAAARFPAPERDTAVIVFATQTFP